MDDFSNDAPLQPKKEKVRIKFKREERDYYSKLFNMAKSKGMNKVTGNDAALFFRKSRLSPDTLKKIWLLAAQTDPSFMDRDEFYVALRLVALAQAKREVSLNAVKKNIDSPLPYFDSIPMPKITPPTQMDPSMMNAGMMNAGMMNPGMMNTGMMNPGMMNAGMMNPGMMNVDAMSMGMMNPAMMNPNMMNPGMMNSGMMNPGMMNPDMMNPGGVPSIMPPPPPEEKPDPYAITQEEASKYSRIYSSFDKTKIGAITADQMTEVLKKTRLPDEALGQVWELAEIDDNGNFSKFDVIVILHLLIKYKSGVPIPSSVPDSLKLTVRSFLQGNPIPPPKSVSSPSAPVASPMMPNADVNDPFADAENGKAIVPPTMFAHPALTAPGYGPGNFSAAGMMKSDSGNSMKSEAIKMALSELQILTPEKERLKNSIAMYKAELAKEEEIQNSQIVAFRDVAAEYNEVLKKVSAGSSVSSMPMPRETAHFSGSNGNNFGGGNTDRSNNYNAGGSSQPFDFS